MSPAIIIIIIIFYIIFKYLEQKDNEFQKKEMKKYARFLLKNKRNKTYKCIVDREIELNVFDYINDINCKHIGTWSDGEKTYFHYPDNKKCRCGYRLNIDKINKILNC